jgi:arginyl-tRNA synthetase
MNKLSTDYTEILTDALKNAMSSLYELEIDSDKVIINHTKKEFKGDYTVVLFPYVKQLRKNPVEIGNAVGQRLLEEVASISEFNVVAGFLNLSFNNDYWVGMARHIFKAGQYGQHPVHGRKVMVEFASPNTNKPLHLGHIRNILLGWSCSRMLSAAGYEVIKTQIVNDRGIAICKSMLAWKEYGNGETPESTGMKGDHFVGKYYVLFEKKFQEEYQQWQQSDEGREVFSNREHKEMDESTFFKKLKNEYFNTYSSVGRKSKDLLIAWENGDEEAVSLWEKMNGWVYEGFEETYERLGVTFDKLYFESDTYLLGKDTIKHGLNKGLFYKADDGSVWIDLDKEGYDQKILLRSDGTSVYMTQDIGTAMARYRDYSPERLVYVVGDEQEYHFQVLFEILKKLEEPYADQLYHLSYGMIELPEGRMKSREGTIVDADDLVEEVVEEARKSSLERGELAGETEEEKNEILRKIGLAALKYFIIRVTPKKWITFNPRESVDMQGQTGPYIQNAYVRIKSILRRDNAIDLEGIASYSLHDDEKDLIKTLIDYPELVRQSAEALNPADLANYLYNLAKTFHKYYHDFRILKAESSEAKSFRLMMISNIAKVLNHGFELLGMEMPERM